MKFFAQALVALTLLPMAFQAQADVSTLTIDASDKVNFVYYGLDDGKLVPVTEADSWILGVRRYIFKTPTGPNGAHLGGGYITEGAGFDAFQTCEGVTFKPDEEISMAGFSVTANLAISMEWYDYNDQGAVKPMDKFFAIASDDDCLKVKIVDYDVGVYQIEYSQLKSAPAESQAQ